MGKGSATKVTEVYQPKYNMNPLSVLCKVINPANNKSQNIRVIFDKCLSVTLLRHSVAEKLGLGSKSVDLAFTTTGISCQHYKDELDVKFLLQSLNGNFTSHPIQAVTIKEVS